MKKSAKWQSKKRGNVRKKKDVNRINVIEAVVQRKNKKGENLRQGKSQMMKRTQTFCKMLQNTTNQELFLRRR